MNKKEKRKYGISWRRRNKSRVKKYARSYYEKNSEKCRARSKAYYFKLKEAGALPKMAKYIGSWRIRNPKKVKAYRLVFSAVRNGSLVRNPCDECGEKKVEAHHEDYSRPLNVRWLCRKHHLEAHRHIKKSGIIKV